MFDLTESKAHFRSDLQGLRGLAVLLVVIYHTGFAIPGGFIGVDMFFVISGFVITQVLLREFKETGKISLRGFYLRRARRLIPALSLVIIFTLLVSLVAMSPFGEQQQIIKTAIASVFFAGNIHLFAMNSYDALTNNPLRHLWSLGVEEQFYWLYPMFFIGLMKISGGKFGRKRILVSLSSLTAFSFLIGFLLTNGFEFGYREGSAIESQLGFLSRFGFIPGSDWPTKFAFFGAPARFWEILVGAILVFLVKKFDFSSRFVWKALALIGVVLVICSSLFLSTASKFPGYLVLMPVIGTALVILLNQHSKYLNKFLGVRSLVFIGDISYSLYLWHWPLIVFARAIWPGSVFASVVLAAVSFLPASLSYKFVESRFRGLAITSGNRWKNILVLAVLPLLVAIPAYKAANTGLGVSIPESKFSNFASVNGCGDAETNLEATCLFGSSKPKFTALLVGDSNARSASDGVVAAVNILDGELLISYDPGCSFRVKSEESDCEELNLFRAEFIKKSRPDLVILVANQTLYAEKFGERLILENIQKTLDFLDDLKIPTIFQGQIPDCDFPLTLYGKYSGRINECRVEIKDQNLRSRLLSNSRDFTVRSSVNVFVNPTQVICPELKCVSIRNSEWIFSDSNHLSPTGSRLLTTLYVEAIQKVLLAKKP